MASSAITKKPQLLCTQINELPKSLVPSVRANEEPGPKCPGSIRKSLIKLLRAWSQVFFFSSFFWDFTKPINKSEDVHNWRALQ